MLIEESEGLANAVEIARASDRLGGHHLRRRRPVGVAAGPGRRQLRPGRRLPRRLLALRPLPGRHRGAGAGIDAIDAPYPAYQDPDGYRRSAMHASLLGFDGKWAIHPSQIPIAHEVFSPTEAEVADAGGHRDLPRSEAEGVGAIGRDGRLVDAAHMRLAENTLHKAALARDERGGARRMSHRRRPRDRGPAAGAGRRHRLVHHRPPGGPQRLHAGDVLRPQAAVRLVNTDPDLAALIITGTGDVFAPAATSAGARSRATGCPTASATRSCRSSPSATARPR